MTLKILEESANGHVGRLPIGFSQVKRSLLENYCLISRIQQDGTADRQFCKTTGWNCYSTTQSSTIQRHSGWYSHLSTFC